MRLTDRNYYGKAFVPGYAPRCADSATCELLWKVTERLAVFEDLLEENELHLTDEMKKKLRKEGILA